jgi:hypothetical protein
MIPCECTVCISFHPAPCSANLTGLPLTAGGPRRLDTRGSRAQPSQAEAERRDKKALGSQCAHVNVHACVRCKLALGWLRNKKGAKNITSNNIFSCRPQALCTLFAVQWCVPRAQLPAHALCPAPASGLRRFSSLRLRASPLTPLVAPSPPLPLPCAPAGVPAQADAQDARQDLYGLRSCWCVPPAQRASAACAPVWPSCRRPAPPSLPPLALRRRPAPHPPPPPRPSCRPPAPQASTESMRAAAALLAASTTTASTLTSSTRATLARWACARRT